MRRGGHPGNLSEGVQILRIAPEFVISYQKAERIPAQRSEFFLVDFLKEGALIELHRVFKIVK